MNYLNQKTLDTEIQAQAVLYFLEGGHFLFRHQDQKAWQSKFVTIQDVADSFTNTRTDTGWIGDGVIRAGRSPRGDWFVFAAPGQKQTLTLATPEGTETLTVPIPATVLIGVGNSYYLFAGAQYVPLGPSAGLFRAPFPNVYSNGRICWGDNSRPPANHLVARAVWDMFFRTPFNTHLSNGKSKAHDNDVNEQLITLANMEKYPLDDLIKESYSLDTMLQRILERDWRE